MKIRLDEWLKRELDPSPEIRTAPLGQCGQDLPCTRKGRSLVLVEEGAVFRDGVQKPPLIHRAFGHGS